MTDDKQTTNDAPVDDEYAPFETKSVPGYTPAPVVFADTNTVERPSATQGDEAAEPSGDETADQKKADTTTTTTRRGSAGKS